MFCQLHHLARELVKFVWKMLAGRGTLQILEENAQPYSLQVQDLHVHV